MKKIEDFIQKAKSNALSNIKQDLSKIKLLITDVDGVLTDGGIFLDNHGNEYKRFNALDGQGLKTLGKNGVEVVIISGSSAEVIKHRAKMMGVETIFLGDINKEPIFDKLCADKGILAEEVVYIGDDLPDLPLIKKAGFGVAVKNAALEVKANADYITHKKGGHGAVREIVDLILFAQGKQVY